MEARVKEASAMYSVQSMLLPRLNYLFPGPQLYFFPGPGGRGVPIDFF